MVKLFRDFYTNYSVSDFIKKSNDGISYIIINNDFFTQAAGGGGNTYDEVITLSINTNLVLVINIDFTALTNLLNNNSVSFSTNIEMNAVSLISSDNQIVSIANLDIQTITNLLTDNSIIINSGLVFESSTNLTTDNLIDAIAGLDFNNSVSLNNDAFVNSIVNLELNKTIDITENSNLENIANLEINKVIDLDIDTDLFVTSETIINQVISLGIESELDLANNLEINSNTNLEADNDLNNNSGGAAINENLIYLTENNIEVSSEKFIDLLTNLIQSANIDNLSFIEYSNFINAEIENTLLAESFINAFNEITLVGNTISTFEVLQIIDANFELTTQTNIVFNSQTELFENKILEINATILFDGIVFRLDYSKREIVLLKSIITNLKIIASKITNNLFFISNLDNKKYLKAI